MSTGCTTLPYVCEFDFSENASPPSPLPGGNEYRRESRNGKKKLTFENGGWTTLRVAGFIILVQGDGRVGEVGFPFCEDVHADGVIDVMGIVLC